MWTKHIRVTTTYRDHSGQGRQFRVPGVGAALLEWAVWHRAVMALWGECWRRGHEITPTIHAPRMVKSGPALRGVASSLRMPISLCAPVARVE